MPEQPVTGGAPWRPVVEALRRHPTLADSLLALLLFGLGVAGMFSTELHATMPAVTAPNALAVVLMAGMTLPLTFRRRAPLVVLATTVGAILPFLVLNFPDVVGGFGPLVALYSVGAHCDRRRSFPALVLTGLVVLPVLIAGTLVEEVQLPWPAVVGNYVIFLTAWALGDGLRSRRAYLAELQQRAEDAERQKEEEAQRAVTAERDRIARELHDVVAHSMAVMVVQAGAARRVLRQDPERADEALRQVERTGRDAMVEMRRMVGVLHDGGGEDGATAPQPGLGTLPTLVEEWRQAGLPTELTVHGEPRPLQAGVDLSAYRIVQEALTNTFKHAGKARAEVELRYGADALDVVVRDDGRGLAANGDGAHSGHGLVGMRERVALVGGEVRAGPRPGGGFEVAARLPLVEPTSA